MMTVRLLCHGSLKETYLTDACAEYAKRLSAFCRLEIREVKTDDDLLLAIRKLPQKDYKVALCIEGVRLSSEEFAEKVGRLAAGGVSSLTFVIGGSEGMSEEMKALCDFRLSFSPMTFPHQLMRVILLEQIYRAFTILKGITYHK